MTMADAVEIVVQINGKVRDRVIEPSGINEPMMRNHVLQRPKVLEVLDGREPRKVIYVPGRLVNIVV